MVTQHRLFEIPLPGILPEDPLSCPGFGLQRWTVHLGLGLTLSPFIGARPLVMQGDVELQLHLSFTDCDKLFSWCRVRASWNRSS